MTESTRAEFEAWWNSSYGQTGDDKEYAFEAWQAATAKCDEGRVMLFIKPLPSENPDEWAIYIRLPTAPITGYFEHFTGVSFDTEAEARDYLAQCGQQSPVVEQEAVGEINKDGDFILLDDIPIGAKLYLRPPTPIPSRQEIEDAAYERAAQVCEWESKCMNNDYEKGAAVCASAIRAMKSAASGMEGEVG